MNVNYEFGFVHVHVYREQDFMNVSREQRFVIRTLSYGFLT